MKNGFLNQCIANISVTTIIRNQIYCFFTARISIVLFCFFFFFVIQIFIERNNKYNDQYVMRYIPTYELYNL